MKLVSFSTGVGTGVGAAVVGGSLLGTSADNLAMDFRSSIVLPLSDNMRRTVRVLCRGILETQERLPTCPERRCCGKLQSYLYINKSTFLNHFCG